MYCLGEFSSTIVSIYWTLLVPACYILAFFPSNITYSKDLFYFFVPFCFHASLVFCTHTHTHFLLTTRYLTVTEGKFHLIPFHIIRHLLGSHCHVMTISEGREQTLFCSLLWFGSLIFCMCVCTIWIDRYSYLYFEVFRNTKFSKYYSIAMLLLILATTFGTFTLKIL